MKTITTKDSEFVITLTQICELIPKLRFIARQVYTIQQLPKGIRFLDAKGDQVAAITTETLKLAQEDFNATFRN